MSSSLTAIGHKRIQEKRRDFDRREVIRRVQVILAQCVYDPQQLVIGGLSVR